MNKVDFKIVHEDGDVSIVRVNATSHKGNVSHVQRMRVMCFDPAQIDRIFHIQENTAKHITKL